MVPTIITYTCYCAALITFGVGGWQAVFDNIGKGVILFIVAIVFLCLAWLFWAVKKAWDTTDDSPLGLEDKLTIINSTMRPLNAVLDFLAKLLRLPFTNSSNHD